MSWKVVDLGCKRGGATDEFLRAGPEFFPQAAGIRPGECLGIDRNATYAADVRWKGYAFRGEDLTPYAVGREAFPAADFYLLWDFLEHLPSIATARSMLRAALAAARVAVWVRMPSFEPDDVTGEGRLTPHGLRFAWTRWVGHPAPFTLLDLERACASMRDRIVEVKARPVLRFTSTSDPRIVLAGEPVDTVRHDPAFGAKPILPLDPPVVGQWDVTIALKAGGE